MLVDIQTLGYIIENAGFQGNIDLVDAITDNLSDDAQTFISPNIWSNTLQGLADAPAFNPDVTQEAANAQVREIMEDLADHSYADIAMLVDIQTLGYIIENASINDNFGLVEAITDNLSDDAQTFIQPSTWSNIIQEITASSSPWVWANSPLSQENADALVNKIMSDLADNSQSDISQIMDIGFLGSTMSFAIMQGQQNIVKAITDNLSDAAQLQVNPLDWSSTIAEIAGGYSITPTHTQEEQNSFLREVMEGLADNSLADISQIIDVSWIDTIAQDLAGAYIPGAGVNSDGLDAFLDNLSDDALVHLDTAALENLGVDAGSNANDMLWGNAGNFEALYGLGGNDYVIGSNGDTALYGGDGVDYVYDFGGSDNDTISGGDGADFLYGGGGADTFVFREGETGVDTVWGFNSGAGDRLDITNYLDQFDPLQDAINDFVILTEANGSTTVSVDVDGTGSGAAQDIAVLSGSTSLDITDVIDVDTGIIV